MEKKRLQLETKISQMARLTSKGIHIVKVGNHPHTKLLPKPEILKTVQMRDIGNAFAIKRPVTQNNIIYIHIYRVLYQNLTGTTNQKSTIDTHVKKKKQSKHNNKDSYQVTRE